MKAILQRVINGELKKTDLQYLGTGWVYLFCEQEERFFADNVVTNKIQEISREDNERITEALPGTGITIIETDTVEDMKAIRKFRLRNI